MLIQSLASIFSTQKILHFPETDIKEKNTATKVENPSISITDSVEISREGNSLAQSHFKNAQDKSQNQKGSALSKELTEEEQKEVDKLKERDQEVRQHEQAHMSAAGQYAKGGPQYEYQSGPDGKRYAIGGHVSIDTSPVANNPEATIRKAQVIKKAANAPAEPSGQDKQVASAANKMEMKARSEIRSERSENQNSVFQPPKESKGQNLNIFA